MHINIIVLNVNDGDAIIVHLENEEKHLVILIDGGHLNDYGKITDALKPVLEKAGLAAPNVVICTHFDTDHILGLTGIVNTYKDAIEQFLIHRTTTVLAERPTPDKQSILPSEDDLVIGGDYMDYRTDPAMDAILEGIKQEKSLIKLIDDYGINSPEPIAGQWKLSDWPEIELLGPTAKYYEELFPDHFTTQDMIAQEMVEIKDEAANVLQAGQDACEALDNFKRSKLTNANLNSVIIKITVDEKAFLFTADAGIESFYNVPEYEERLKNIFWLKVPHHGSANNINSGLIKLMQPKIAVISGKRHCSPLVVACLQKHCPKVEITSVAGTDLIYNF